MIRFFKNLKWLIKNRDNIEELINIKKDIEKNSKEEDMRYSLAGVPEYQLSYIDDKLKDESVK